MYNVSIFGIELTLNPVAFTIPIGSGWDVYWYGIVIACGFALAITYGYLNAKRFGLDIDRMLDVILVATPVAILCARAYYLIFDGEKLGSIKEFFGFDGSGFTGLAIYGGVIGALASGFVMCKIRKVKILDMFDLAVIGFLIGQGIGRWGNFFNQEAYGTFTGSDFWGMTSNKIQYEMGEGLVHPCFLYESIWCLIGVLVLHKLSKKRQFSGEITLLYCIWYGFERGFVELLRTDSLMLGSIRVSSLLSFVICIGASVTLVLIKKKLKENKTNTEYTSMFQEEINEENKVSEE
ncbi:MAG: prolipoprotein diacylglyceryl transferase [Clostridia bacterium]|nr:prolipoprotein diacylglyceryl transferase [Clostridia bacterium]